MDRYLIKPDTNLDLKKHDPDDTSLCPEGSEAGLERLAEETKALATHKAIVFARRKEKLLIVLQGMDASGKDGTVRGVFSGVSHVGVRCASFDRPTRDDLAHDFLWRVHKVVPHAGEITVFNRSHYEDVLAVRVRKLASKEVWKKRYKHIVNFEKLLTDEGTRVVKFFLNISYDEQKRRLQSRLKKSHKHWKFNPSDIADRKLWPEYREAYEDAIKKTSTKNAPWYVIPSNNKWYRNLAVAKIINHHLNEMELSFPPPHFEPDEYSLD
ncbi:MAG: PPK2 family polyphosphate:nucleotide phosphotransferase [Verrucomicrobiales bacterium]|jgi:PPK2 family polyphosphate:nucleotide phosphotransferase